MQIFCRVSEGFSFHDLVNLVETHSRPGRASEPNPSAVALVGSDETSISMCPSHLPLWPWKEVHKGGAITPLIGCKGTWR